VRICLIPSTFDGAGSYRLLFPGGYLAERGHEVVLPRWVHLPEQGLDVFENIDVSLREIDADVYVVQQPLDAATLGAIRVLKGLGKTVFGETDDDFRHLPSYHPAREATDPVRHPERNRRIQEECFALCDGLTVSTPALAESYADLSPVVLPNLLHWPMWSDVTPVYEREFRRVRVGWMGGLEWREDDLKVLRGVIGPWLERNPHVEFVAAGDQRVHDFLGVPYGQRVTSARVAFRNMDLAYITAVMDVGLVPLARNRFNEGKSYLKGLEYGACGIPCVATPTQQYEEWVDEGSNGFLASRPSHWLRALDELVADTDLRREMGRASRAKAREFSLDRQGVDGWEKAYGDGHNANASRPRAAVGGVPGVSTGADGSVRASGGGRHRTLWTPDRCGTGSRRWRRRSGCFRSMTTTF
jgi:glycosyltransferase involved in cell wall biosynthesis